MHPLNVKRCEDEMPPDGSICRSTYMLQVACTGVPGDYFVRTEYSDGRMYGINALKLDCTAMHLMMPGTWKGTPQPGGGQYGSRNPGRTAILIIFDASISTNTYEYVHVNTCTRNTVCTCAVPAYVPAHVLARRQCTSTKGFRVSRIGAAKGCFRHWQLCLSAQRLLFAALIFQF